MVRLLVFAALCFVGCFSLSPGAKTVQFVVKADPPKGCQLVGSVDTKSGSAGLTISILYEDDVHTILRNKVAERGGNFLVIDSITNAPDDDGTLVFNGAGRGFRCANLKPMTHEASHGAFDVRDTKIPPIPDP